MKFKTSYQSAYYFAFVAALGAMGAWMAAGAAAQGGGALAQGALLCGGALCLLACCGAGAARDRVFRSRTVLDERGAANLCPGKERFFLPWSECRVRCEQHRSERGGTQVYLVFSRAAQELPREAENADLPGWAMRFDGDSFYMEASRRACRELLRHVDAREIGGAQLLRASGCGAPRAFGR